jgi:hypothetical protein
MSASYAAVGACLQSTIVTTSATTAITIVVDIRKPSAPG